MDVARRIAVAQQARGIEVGGTLLARARGLRGRALDAVDVLLDGLDAYRALLAGLGQSGDDLEAVERLAARAGITLRYDDAKAKGEEPHDHDVPLEPVLLGARRLGFKEISGPEYQVVKDQILALPH